jgi:hypothetical protein
MNTLDAYPPQYKYPSYLDQVMKACFIVDPAARPTFETLVHILDEHVPAGVTIQRGPGWMAEDMLAVIQDAPRERRGGKGTGESSEEKTSSIWDSDGDSGQELTRIKTNYIDTV